MNQDSSSLDTCSSGINDPKRVCIEIIEQPKLYGFGSFCARRPVRITGARISENLETYLTIKIHNLQSDASLVVSLVSFNGPPYYPHPHKLVGNSCNYGVYCKRISITENVVSFSDLAIQFVKEDDIQRSLSKREFVCVDPYGTGFSYASDRKEINLNAVRLCFQVILPETSEDAQQTCNPVVSTPIFDDSCMNEEYSKLDVCSYITKASNKVYIKIIEEPKSDGTRFRYEKEGRATGIPGANSNEDHKTYPTIKIYGYHGELEIVISLVSLDGPCFSTHPHRLVGNSCKNGVYSKLVCNTEKAISFPDFGIRCVKHDDKEKSLAERKAAGVDPFNAGFSHASDNNKINFSAVRLCFEVILPKSSGKVCSPQESSPIFDSKIFSDLSITELSHTSAPVTGGQKVILLCGNVSKKDIEIVFYEEKNGEKKMLGQGLFSPDDVHRKTAIIFQTPAYENLDVEEDVNCIICLKRISDETEGRPKKFTLTPIKKGAANQLHPTNEVSGREFISPSPSSIRERENYPENIRLPHYSSQNPLSRPAATFTNIASNAYQAANTFPHNSDGAANQFYRHHENSKSDFNSPSPASVHENETFSENISLPHCSSQNPVSRPTATFTNIAPNAHQADHAFPLNSNGTKLNDLSFSAVSPTVQPINAEDDCLLHGSVDSAMIGYNNLDHLSSANQNVNPILLDDQNVAAFSPTELNYAGNFGRSPVYDALLKFISLKINKNTSDEARPIQGDATFLEYGNTDKPDSSNLSDMSVSNFSLNSDEIMQYSY